MGLLDFLSPEAGQDRRRALDQGSQSVIDMLQYYFGPTGAVDKLGHVNELFNPVVGLEQAGIETQQTMAPGKTPGERFQHGTNAVLETLAAGAPIGVAKLLGRAAPPVANTVSDVATGGLLTPDMPTSAPDPLMPRAEPLGPAAPRVSQTESGLTRRAWEDPQGRSFAEFMEPEGAQFKLPPEAPAANLPAVRGAAVPSVLDQIAPDTPRVFEDVDPNTLRYSPTRRALEEMTYKGGDKGRAQGWDKMRNQLIKHGAKAEEMEWLGLESEFGGQTAVSKQQVQDYLSKVSDIYGVSRASRVEYNKRPRAADRDARPNTATATLDPETSTATTWGERAEEVREYFRNQYIDSGDPDGPVDIDEVRDRILGDPHQRDEHIQSELDNYYLTSDYLDDGLHSDGFLRIGDMDDDELIDMIVNTDFDQDYDLPDGTVLELAEATLDDLMFPEADPRQGVLPVIGAERGGLRPGVDEVLEDIRRSFRGQWYDADNRLDGGDTFTDRVVDVNSYTDLERLEDHFDLRTMVAESWENYVDEMDDDTLYSYAGVDEDDLINNAMSRHPNEYLDEGEVHQSLWDEGYEDEPWDSPYPFGTMPPVVGPDFGGTPQTTPDGPDDLSGVLSDPDVIEGTFEDITAPEPAPIPRRNVLYPPDRSPAFGDNFTKGSGDYMTTTLDPTFRFNAPTGEQWGTGGQPGSHTVMSNRPDSGEPLARIRPGIFPVRGETLPDGSAPRAFHIGEIQSDWGQSKRKLETSIKDFPKRVAEARASAAKFGREFTEYDLERMQRQLEEEKRRLARIQPGPLIDQTNRWADAGMRQGIADAVLEDADYVTLGTGEMAAEMTYLKEGAKTFYDKQLPERMQKLANDIWPGQNVRVRTIEIPTSRGVRKVPSIKLTPEMKMHIRRTGLPLASVGGAAGVLEYLNQEQEQRPDIPLLGGNI